MRKGKAMLSVALAAAMTLGSAVPALADGDKTKVVFMSRDSGDTPIAKVYEDQIARFMEENPDIEVQNDSVYEEAAYNNKLKVALSTGETPHSWLPMRFLMCSLHGNWDTWNHSYLQEK